jgi:hypothetical protein
MCITMGWSSTISKHDYTYNVLILSHNQTWQHMTLCLFLCYCFFPMPITAHKKRFLLSYMKRPNIFFQDRAFSHRVAFKCLHKRLWPFTDAGLHKRGVQLLGDDRWGACLPYLMGRKKLHEELAWVDQATNWQTI